GDVEPGLDHAVVAERDAHTGLGAHQRAATDAHPLGAAPGERPHGRGAPADVGPVTDDDTLGDAALDHRGTQGPGVEVHEALVHDGGALGQVRAQAHPVRVPDAHTGGQHVVHHPGEPVEAE